MIIFNLTPWTRTKCQPISQARRQASEFRKQGGRPLLLHLHQRHLMARVHGPLARLRSKCFTFITRVIITARKVSVVVISIWPTRRRHLPGFKRSCKTCGGVWCAFLWKAVPCLSLLGVTSWRALRDATIYLTSWRVSKAFLDSVTVLCKTYACAFHSETGPHYSSGVKCRPCDFRPLVVTVASSTAQ